MKPNEIRAQLMLEKVIPAEIARLLKVKPQAVYRVIDGKSVSGRIRNVIAATLNLSSEDIWPTNEQVA